MNSFGARAHLHGAVVLADPVATERTALSAAQRELRATPVGPRVVDR
jgi:hypothetical protein